MAKIWEIVCQRMKMQKGEKDSEKDKNEHETVSQMGENFAKKEPSN